MFQNAISHLTKGNVRDSAASELLSSEFKEELLSPGSVPELFFPGIIKRCDQEVSTFHRIKG